MQSESIDLYCSKSFKAINKKHRTFERNYTQSATVLNAHLCPSKGVRPISQKHLVHVCDGDGYAIWKQHVMVQGLKPGQWPRLWIGVATDYDLLVPLDLRVHGDNYDDNAVERAAEKQMNDHLFDLLSNEH